MRLAPFPPNSSVTRFKVSAAARDIDLPARVEPVKEIMSTSGWVDLQQLYFEGKLGCSGRDCEQAMANPAAIAVDEVENARRNACAATALRKRNYFMTFCIVQLNGW